MTKIDVTPIEEMHRHLCAEIATLREVNEAQAEQLRKAQERIRAAEAERDHAWNMVAKADADAVRCAAQSLEDKIRANAAEAERDEWRRKFADNLRSVPPIIARSGK